MGGRGKRQSSWAKDTSLILLAFVILAIYLLILGSINRRQHPLLVYGPWDFVGVLFAASGFLLLTGPEVLKVLNERWRQSILFGENPAGATSATESLWLIWLILLTAYFALVVSGSALLLWRSRNHTSIYNVDQETIERTLTRIFARLGLKPLRSGTMFYFGRTTLERTNAAPQETRVTQSAQADSATLVKEQPVHLLAQPNVILEVDAFRPLWHVTLHWEPVNSGVRQEIERELERDLSEIPAPDHVLGVWMTLGGFALFLLVCFIGMGMLLYYILHHRFG